MAKNQSDQGSDPGEEIDLPPPDTRAWGSRRKAAEEAAREAAFQAKQAARQAEAEAKASSDVALETEKQTALDARKAKKRKGR